MQWQGSETQSYSLKISLRNFNKERDVFPKDSYRNVWRKTIRSRETCAVIVQGRDKDHQKQGKGSINGKMKTNQEILFNVQDVQDIVTGSLV